MLTGFFRNSDFIVVLQTGFWSGSGFLPLGSGLESDSNKLESEHLWWIPELAPDSECRSRFGQDSAFFFRTRIRTQSQKLGGNRNGSGVTFPFRQ